MIVALRSILASAIVVCALAGCVERRLFIRSDPAGAEVSVNGQPVGLTPVKVPFVAYGYYDIVASAPGHHRLSKIVEISPPWWEYVPFDFFVEMVWPFRVADEREITLDLVPLSPADDAGLAAREGEMRRWLEKGGEPPSPAEPSSRGEQ